MRARAVKGGKAEAPDVSAPSLEGPGNYLITMELAGRDPAGLNAIFWPGSPVAPRLEGALGDLVGRHRRCKCVYPFVDTWPRGLERVRMALIRWASGLSPNTRSTL